MIPPNSVQSLQSHLGSGRVDQKDLVATRSLEPIWRTARRCGRTHEQIGSHWKPLEDTSDQYHQYHSNIFKHIQTSEISRSSKTWFSHKKPCFLPSPGFFQVLVAEGIYSTHIYIYMGLSGIAESYATKPHRPNGSTSMIFRWHDLMVDFPWFGRKPTVSFRKTYNQHGFSTSMLDYSQGPQQMETTIGLAASKKKTWIEAANLEWFSTETCGGCSKDVDVNSRIQKENCGDRWKQWRIWPTSELITHGRNIVRNTKKDGIDSPNHVW